jgi:hypothetical protein
MKRIFISIIATLAFISLSIVIGNNLGIDTKNNIIITALLGASVEILLIGTYIMIKSFVDDFFKKNKHT